MASINLGVWHLPLDALFTPLCLFTDIYFNNNTGSARGTSTPVRVSSFFFLEINWLIFFSHPCCYLVLLIFVYSWHFDNSFDNEVSTYYYNCLLSRNTPEATQTSLCIYYVYMHTMKYELRIVTSHYFKKTDNGIILYF